MQIQKNKSSVLERIGTIARRAMRGSRRPQKGPRGQKVVPTIVVRLPRAPPPLGAFESFLDPQKRLFGALTES